MNYQILVVPFLLCFIIYRYFAILVIVKASSGPRYVVGCRSKVDKDKLTSGTRVVLDMTTLTIMRALPREVSKCIGYYALVYLVHLLINYTCVSTGYLLRY